MTEVIICRGKSRGFAVDDAPVRSTRVTASTVSLQFISRKPIKRSRRAWQSLFGGAIFFVKHMLEPNDVTLERLKRKFVLRIVGNYSTKHHDVAARNGG
jgi:hypothetical protein